MRLVNPMRSGCELDFGRSRDEERRTCVNPTVIEQLRYPVSPKAKAVGPRTPQHLPYPLGRHSLIKSADSGVVNLYALRQVATVKGLSEFAASGVIPGT